MYFAPQPILEGKLLTLRPLQPVDFQELCAVASDPLIWEQHPNSDRYQEVVFKEFFREALESGGARVGSRLDKNGRDNLVYQITKSRFEA